MQSFDVDWCLSL